MKSKIAFFILVISVLFSFTPLAVKVVTWEDLSAVNYRRTFSPRHSTFYNKPIFDKNILKLHGEQIQISGYVIPVDTYGEKFYLSASPKSSCFFCGAGEAHSIMELKLKNLPANYKVDEFLTFKGTLITHSDLEHIPYSLDNAELVKE